MYWPAYPRAGCVPALNLVVPYALKVRLDAVAPFVDDVVSLTEPS